MKSQSRRDFFKTLVLGVSVIPFFGAIRSVQANPGVPDKEIGADDPLGKSLEYTSNAAKVAVNKGKKGADVQTCKNCQFYKPTKGDLGTCDILRTGLVRGSGWCKSWVKKAA